MAFMVIYIGVRLCYDYDKRLAECRKYLSVENSFYKVPLYKSVNIVFRYRIYIHIYIYCIPEHTLTF